MLACHILKRPLTVNDRHLFIILPVNDSGHCKRSKRLLSSIIIIIPTMNVTIIKFISHLQV